MKEGKGRKPKCECIVVANQKGGVGKSTTALQLAAGLSRRHGEKVVCLDMDSQGNLTFSTGSENDEYNVMRMIRSPEEVELCEKPVGDIVVIPSSLELGALGASAGDLNMVKGLRAAVDRLRKEFTVIVIDSPPSLGLITVSALSVCDSVIITTQPSSYGLQGIGQLYQTIETVRTHVNPSLRIRGILATRYRGRVNIARDMMEMLEETAHQLGTKVYEEKIRECAAIEEANTLKQDIFQYAPSSNAGQDYGLFVDEVEKDLRKERKRYDGKE